MAANPARSESMSPHPRQLVSSWDEAALLIRHYRRRPVDVDALQAKVIDFWACLRIQIQRTVGYVISKSFIRRYSAF